MPAAALLRNGRGRGRAGWHDEVDCAGRDWLSSSSACGDAACTPTGAAARMHHGCTNAPLPRVGVGAWVLQPARMQPRQPRQAPRGRASGCTAGRSAYWTRLCTPRAAQAARQPGAAPTSSRGPSGQRERCCCCVVVERSSLRACVKALTIASLRVHASVLCGLDANLATHSSRTLCSSYDSTPTAAATNQHAPPITAPIKFCADHQPERGATI